jgi:plasmid stabilization system protein ParE
LTLSWSERARQDLREALGFIARDSPTAARRVQREIRQQVSNLARFPELGREGLLVGTRELIFARLPYIAIYRLTDNGLEILRFRHASRDELEP